MARRGNDIVVAYQQRIRAEKDMQPVTTRCLWCDTPPVTMTLAEGRQWLATHVKNQHPERVPNPRFGGRRSSHRMLGKQTIENNIANARAQGASTWVNQEQPEWA